MCLMKIFPRSKSARNITLKCPPPTSMIPVFHPVQAGEALFNMNSFISTNTLGGAKEIKVTDMAYFWIFV